MLDGKVKYEKFSHEILLTCFGSLAVNAKIADANCYYTECNMNKL